MISIILILTSWANSNITTTTYPTACRDPHIAAKQCMAGSNTSSCVEYVNQCVTGCSNETVMVYSEKLDARSRAAQCKDWAQKMPDVTTSSAKSECSDAITQLAACKENCKPDYDSCVTTCRQVTDTIERTEAFRRCDANYRGKPISTSTANAEPVDPTEPTAPTEPEPKNPNDDAVDPRDPVPPSEQNAGETNTLAQLSSLQGLGNTPYAKTKLSNDAGAIDFSSGTNPDIGGYQQVGGVQGASAAAGYVGNGGDYNLNGELPRGELVGGGPPSGGSGNGGGNAGGGGAPPANSSSIAGGGGGNGGGGNGAKRPNGAGGSRNGAAEYLSRHSPFSFQSAGGSPGPGNNNKRNVANDKTKKPFGPTYIKKENDGKDALHRLFGNGATPASYRRNPYAGSAACGNTILCNMEIYHNKLEYIPNQGINPDSL
jgi:hypothetical protein